MIGLSTSFTLYLIVFFMTRKMKFQSRKCFAILVLGNIISIAKSVKINSNGFDVLKEKRCSNPILSTSKAIRSKIECVALCERTSGCGAVNYNRKTRQCQLLGASDGGCAVESDLNSVHIYDKSVNLDGKSSYITYKRFRWVALKI